MPATGLDGLEITRRSLLFSLIPAGLWADAETDRTAITEMFGAVAASLSEDNPAGAMKWFDPSMPRIGRLRSALFALVGSFELSSEISILSIEKEIVVLDWFLQLKSRVSSAAVERRRANITCSVGQQGKDWKIRTLEPVEFFE